MNPNDFTFIDLFSGIGGIRIAFETVNGKCLWSCEWDKDVQKIYKINFGDQPAGDIYQIPISEIPDHDVLLAGFPCPTYSIIGKREGLNNKTGELFFEIIRILKAKNPHAFLLENVKDLKNHDHGKTLEYMLQQLRECNYFVNWKILNALDFGLPQKRQRIIIVGFKENYDFVFPEGNKQIVSLNTVLEKDENVDRFYFASEKVRKNRMEAVKNKKIFYPSIWHENKSGNISILPYSCALRASASYNYLLVNGVRRLTPREMLRLQGFPETFQLIGNYSLARKVTGNSVPIPMIRAVAEKMMCTIAENKILNKNSTYNIMQAKLTELK